MTSKSGSDHVSREVFDALWDAAEKEKAARAEAMPTEQDAIKALNQAYQRLKELGWNDPIYCPKDGSHFDVIEVGSTGIHRARYEGEWPTGNWWVEEAGDLWPSRPTLYRVTDAEKERWAAAVARYRAQESEDTPPCTPPAASAV